MLSQKNRLAYAGIHREQYLDWCRELSESPYSPLDKLEFACISAHAPMARAIGGFEATRHETSLQGIVNALDDAGVMASGRKASWILGIRREYASLGTPSLPYRQYRQEHKLPGLGICKLSFGCALIEPLLSDVCCLDTHMLQLLTGYMPSANEVGKVYRSLESYQSYEDILDWEARQVDMPLFAYQWAVWDYKRGIVDHKEPEDHSFLWRSGSTKKQLPLFSSLE